MKRGLSYKARLSVYLSVCVPTLICREEVWVMTETMETQMKESRKAFLCSESGVALPH